MVTQRTVKRQAIIQMSAYCIEEESKIGVRREEAFRPMDSFMPQKNTRRNCETLNQLQNIMPLNQYPTNSIIIMMMEPPYRYLSRLRNREPCSTINCYESQERCYAQCDTLSPGLQGRLPIRNSFVKISSIIVMPATGC